jgi:SAM-dependent methyltransferase
MTRMAASYQWKRVRRALALVLIWLFLCATMLDVRRWRAPDHSPSTDGGAESLYSKLARLSPKDVMASLAPHMKQCTKEYATEPPPPLLYESGVSVSSLLTHLKTHGVTSIHSYPHNETFVSAMRVLPKDVRERLSYDSNNPVLYFEEEAAAIQLDEQQAVLRAAPIKELEKLNGLNIGAGGRSIPGTIPMDAHRTVKDIRGLPAVQENVPGTMLGWASKLPFKSNSIDLIVSLHNLEHVSRPVLTVAHYIDVLKPGGGVGIVLPHADYAWLAQRDDSPWGHRWSPRPELVCAMFRAFWAEEAELLHLSTLSKGRMSFDVVLRKSGLFTAFESDSIPDEPVGKDLHEMGDSFGEV